MHSRSIRTVSPALAINGTNADLIAQQALLAGNPGLQQDLTATESFTGAVPKTLKGSKAYWRAAFVQLMAMCIEYGAPEFFLTLTANEMGWVDLRAACNGRAAGDAPVEATRHYNHRWQEFKSRFLTGDTPIGKITRKWYRQEEQGRGSLHIHAALWVTDAKPEAICAMAPR